MKHLAILSNRSIISISGIDKKEFLQGLITNDINKVSENQAIYAFHLNPQGRFLYDFFIVENGDKLLLDIQKEKEDEILKKFSFYKLRSKVEIAKEAELLVAASFDKSVFESEKIVFQDPRTEKIGFRAFCHSSKNWNLEKKELDQNLRGDDILKSGNDMLKYDLARINLKLPDDSDLTYEKSFPLEFGFENFNAIDYKKGCYIGQETTARMHYKSVIRKKIFLVEILQKNVSKGEKIISQDKEIGEILSSVFDHGKLFALALIKNLDNDDNQIDLNNLSMCKVIK